MSPSGCWWGRSPSNQVYELTGPELLTFAEATAAIATATGRPITYTEISVPELVADLTADGFPAADAEELGACSPTSSTATTSTSPTACTRPWSGTAQLHRVRRARGRARCLGWSGGCVVTGVVTGVGQTLGEARPPSR